MTDPWLPWPPQEETHNAESQRADPTSILHLYRRLLAARRRSPALQLGAYQPLTAPDGVLAYERVEDDDRRVVVVNFTSDEVAVPVSGSWAVEVASDGAGERGPYRGVVGPDQAVVLR